MKSAPGKVVNLKASRGARQEGGGTVLPRAVLVLAAAAAAEERFPGTGDKGNGISENIKSQGEWIRSIVNTDGCTGCHQIGGPATREIPPSILSQFEDSKKAWDRRIQSGQAGGGMNARFTQVGRTRALGMYTDWTDRIAKGALPDQTPPRPQGIERNVVVTMWDWADPKVYLHDAICDRQAQPDDQPERPDLRRARR